MKHLASFVLVVALLFSFSTGDARDTRHTISIESALAWGEEEGVLLSSIRLYFGEEDHPAVESNLGEFTSNRKTNAVGKSDEKACKWAFLSAMKTLQERAIKEGGNAVINIYSNYKKNEFVSTTEFECGAGATVAGVTMIGEVVKLAE
jgi:uncharacterized protein YbjQ (UPF0145 family)